MIRCNALKCISRFNENYSKYVYYNTNYSSRFTVTVQIHQGYISLAKSKNGLLREITRILFCQRNEKFAILARRTLATCIFFESFPKKTQKRRILRILIQINPSNPRRERIHCIHNPFLDFTKEKKNPFLDSESGLGFFPKNCTLRLNNLKSFLGNKKPSR